MGNTDHPGTTGMRGKRLATTGGALLAALVLASACSDASSTAPDAIAAKTISAARVPAAYTFETISVPGSLGTVPQGINAGGEIVGYYWDGDYGFHGFIWRHGVFTTIDYPEADGTDARGIGPSGEIVGTYWDDSEPGAAAHGYRMSAQGKFTPIAYPGHLYMFAQRVLPDGTILGCYHDEDTGPSMKGITMSTAGNEEVALYASMNNGATPDRQHIVGSYVNQAAGNRSEAFTIDNGVITPLFIAGSIMTAGWDINPRGQIAGVYRTATGFHGYVLTNRDFATMVTLDAPGAAATRAFGINARGDVVGTFVSAGHTYGFVARAGN